MLRKFQMKMVRELFYVAKGNDTVMIDRERTQELPALDDMLQSLLLMEEGEHEFVSEDEEVSELRQLLFPVTREGVYLKHAVMGPLPRPVAQAMRDYVDDVSRFGDVHEESWKQYRDGAHRRMAGLLHTRAEQVAFTANSRDSLMRLAYALDWQEGDAMLVVGDEPGGNASAWLDLVARGVKVQTIPMRDQRLTNEDIFACIDKQTRLVSVSHVLPATGFRSDVAALTAYCRERAIVCGVDATQSLGALDVDVQRLGIDYLVAEGHKWLLAPQSSGILYVSDDLFARLHQSSLRVGMERFEYGAPNSFPIVGLDAALGVLECIDGGMQAVEERILGLGAYAIAGLERLGYPIISPRNQGERSGIVCFTTHPERRDLTVQKIVESLEERNIYIAAHEDVASISPHFYSTPEDIDALLKMLEELKRPVEGQ